MKYFQEKTRSSPSAPEPELKIAELEKKYRDADEELSRRRPINQGINAIKQAAQGAADLLGRLGDDKAKKAIEGQPNWLRRVLSFAPWMVVIILSCWGLFSALSLFAGLPFLVDGWGWLISHLAGPFSGVFDRVGNRIFEAVSSYREVILRVGYLLHLPVLPQYVYDCLGLFACLLGLAFQFLKRETFWGIIVAPLFLLRLRRAVSASIATAATLLLLAGIAAASYQWWRDRPATTPPIQQQGPPPQAQQGPQPQGQQGPPPQARQGSAPQGQQDQPIPPEPPPPRDVTASIPLVFSRASLLCGKEPPISWKFGDVDLIESDPVPLAFTSCRFSSVSCQNPTIIGVGMASVKGTDASEHDRALMRGKNLALVLEGDLKRRCKPDVSISAYILNLGRFNDDQQGDKSDQREVIALVGAGSTTPTTQLQPPCRKMPRIPLGHDITRYVNCTNWAQTSQHSFIPRFVTTNPVLTCLNGNWAGGHFMRGYWQSVKFVIANHLH